MVSSISLFSAVSTLATLAAASSHAGSFAKHRRSPAAALEKRGSDWKLDTFAKVSEREEECCSFPAELTELRLCPV